MMPIRYAMVVRGRSTGTGGLASRFRATVRSGNRFFGDDFLRAIIVLYGLCTRGHGNNIVVGHGWGGGRMA
jgi:hypothetical protein